MRGVRGVRGVRDLTGGKVTAGKDGVPLREEEDILEGRLLEGQTG